MLRAYKYRLLPTEDQAKTLVSWMGMCRFIYNLGLETKSMAWAMGQKRLSSFDLMKQLTDLKRTECKWLSECPAQSLESVITNLDSAFNRFFKGGGYPKFKKKSGCQSISFRQYSFVDGSKIKLMKIGWIEFIQHRPLGIGEIRTVSVSKNSAGKFFVSILIENNVGVPPKQDQIPETTVGIDVGLKTFATFSDGHKVDNPKYFHQQLKRLRIEQRKLKRRYKKGIPINKQSKGYHKQKLVVATLHEKIANQRKDFLHKTSTAIIKQYDTVCLEDLNIAGIMQNNKLSKAVADVSWSEFVKMLEYKAEWLGKNIKRAGRFYASSKTCSECGFLNNELKLEDRSWTCPRCGIFHDRDINAAINIKKYGFKAEPSTANESQ